MSDLVVSNSYGGSGGDAFDHRELLNQHNPRISFEEYYISAIEVGTWRCVGHFAVEYTHLSNSFPPVRFGHGRIAAGNRIRFDLVRGEHIVECVGSAGREKIPAGAVTVDFLQFRTNSGRKIVFGNSHHTSISRPFAVTPRANHVVRYFCGRVGDSLDALQIVHGPKPPVIWSVEAHPRYPRNYQRVAETVLMASRRPSTDSGGFHLLPKSVQEIVLQYAI